MTATPGDAVTRAALTELPEQQRQRAFDRYQTLRPHLERARTIIGKGLTVREAAVRIKVGKTALYEALSPGSARAN